ncbi:MAG: HAMP domain-containing sensor histidine kinase [Bacillota bacterium]|nr:HAMP domain-containing sensor histidine kinase [Bacillota bacterium]
MRISIKTRLFVTVSLLITFFVLVSWFLNWNYLEKFYEVQTRNKLEQESDLINQIYAINAEDTALEFEKLERSSGLNILILDRQYEIIYHSRGIEKFDFPIRDKTRIVRPTKTEPLVRIVTSNLPRLLAEKKIFVIHNDPIARTKLLTLISKMDNGDYLLLSTPLVAMQQSAAIANRFFLLTGLLTIIVGSIVMYFFSRRFTRPILELNDITRQMSALDFSKKYISHTNDELGDLGNNINSLSDQLDQSITELQEANAKLRQDIEHERQIDEMRKEFISNVSHELKTPIALIQGYVEGLKLNVAENAEDKEYYCDVISDESAKMNIMVRQLLDLSQMDSGNYHLDLTEFNIVLLVKQIVDKFDPILKEKNITLTLNTEPTIIVKGDELRLEQVVVNYLNNAINHIDDTCQIIIQLKSLDEHVRVSVFNIGKPIPEDVLDKVFTSFYKVDKARTRAYGGTGLGLSIVRAIMDKHQNAYGVINQPNGVEFWFEVNQVN